MKRITRAQGVVLLAAVFSAALMVGGCSTTRGIEATGTKSWDSDGAPRLSSRVVINNASLAKGVEIVELKDFLAGDLMTAQVSLRSNKRDVLPIQYKFEWFDGQGMQLSGNSAWKPVTIYGGESLKLQGVAPDPRAREFMLKIREQDSD